MYEWEDNSVIVDTTCYFVDDTKENKYSIKAFIEYSDQGGWPSAQIEIFIKNQEDKTTYGSYRLKSNENIFFFDIGQGSAEDLKQKCQEFYEKNLKDREITKEYLLGLKKELSNV